MKYEFSKPYVFEGKTYEFLDVDTDKLNGYVMSSAKRKYTRAGLISAVVEMDSDYCVYVLAELCSLPLEFFYQLPGQDYSRLTRMIGNFLMG